jgi:hypothetical protein
MNSNTSPSLLSSKYVDVPIMSGVKRLPEDVVKKGAPHASKSKPLSPFLSPVPIKTFIPTVAHPAGHMLNIGGIAQTDRGRKCDTHDCCGDVVKEDVIVRLRRKQHVWKNKATGKLQAACLEEQGNRKE